MSVLLPETAARLARVLALMDAEQRGLLRDLAAEVREHLRRDEKGDIIADPDHNNSAARA